MNDSSTTRKPWHLTRDHTTPGHDNPNRAGLTTNHTTPEAAKRVMRKEATTDPTLTYCHIWHDHTPGILTTPLGHDMFRQGDRWERQ